MLGFSPSSRTNLKLNDSGETDEPDDWRWRELGPQAQRDARADGGRAAQMRAADCKQLADLREGAGARGGGTGGHAH
jgi:hypothetical protein